MNQSQRERMENEVVFKHRNQKIELLATKVLDEDSRQHMSIGFVCECSNENCQESMSIPLEEFKDARQNSRQFIIKAGHEQPDIEEVVSHDGYDVVEKFEQPPATDGKLNRT